MGWEGYLWQRKISSLTAFTLFAPWQCPLCLSTNKVFWHWVSTKFVSTTKKCAKFTLFLNVRDHPSGMWYNFVNLFQNNHCNDSNSKTWNCKSKLSTPTLKWPFSSTFDLQGMSTQASVALGPHICLQPLLRRRRKSWQKHKKPEKTWVNLENLRKWEKTWKHIPICLRQTNKAVAGTACTYLEVVPFIYTHL